MAPFPQPGPKLGLVDLGNTSVERKTHRSPSTTACVGFDGKHELNLDSRPADRSLATIQRWLQTVIIHPDGIKPGILSLDAQRLFAVTPDETELVILPSARMTSIERLQIYNHAYFGRLIECLEAQFPAVCHAVGDELFRSLACGLLVEYPSASYTLGKLGESFEQFLTQTRPARDPDQNHDGPDFADFLIDLAQLERVYGEVFDEAGPEQTRSLELRDLDGLTADEFAGCQLTFHGCVRLLKVQFPVHEYSTAVRQGIEPKPPVCRPICLVVTRREYVVRRFEVTATQFDLLAALKQQTTIGDALHRLFDQSAIDAEEMRVNLRASFRDWSAAPLFAGLVRGNGERGEGPLG